MYDLFIDMTSSPIFIHSLFRAGSTYIFHVFRRSDTAYWCYQEPLHEISFYSRENHDLLLLEHTEKMELLRHPVLGDPYFRELYDVASQCLVKLSKEAIYDAYFSPINTDIGIDYLRALINAAKGRPVIQECRTASRIGAIKSALGGCHIYLWRNPWDQWWSYKVTDYFDAVNQMFINAQQHPEIINILYKEINFIPRQTSDINSLIKWFQENELSPEHSYLIFYILWCLGLREGMANADELINIDSLSKSFEYRGYILKRLSSKNITEIDFSDCISPQSIYTSKEKTFFSRIENKAHGLFLISGMPQAEIDELLVMRHQHTPQIWVSPIINIEPSSLLRDAERARCLLLKTTEEKVELRLKFKNEIALQKQNIINLEIRANEAEERFIQAEERFIQLESNANQWRQQAIISQERVHALEKSLSWHITTPLRTAHFFLVNGFKYLSKYSRSAVKALLLSAMRTILDHPMLTFYINKLLIRYSWLYQILVQMAQSEGLTPMGLQNLAAMNLNSLSTADSPFDKDLLHLSPLARQIYYDLKTAIEKSRKNR